MSTYNRTVVVRLKQEGSRVDLYLAGEIDCDNAKQLRDILSQIVNRLPDGGRVILRLDKTEVPMTDSDTVSSPGVTYCSEDCVAVLIDGWKSMRRHGISLELVANDPLVRRSFMTKGLEHVMKVYADKQELEE